MKLKEVLKERVKERITEATGLSAYQSGSSNSARWTPPGQPVELSIPQLSGFYQVEKPVADDPIPRDSAPDGPDTHVESGTGAKYNNKIRRNPTGELTASGMPGDAYASPAEYVNAHEAEAEHEATA
jgi:hypothetical protein